MENFLKIASLMSTNKIQIMTGSGIFCLIWCFIGFVWSCIELANINTRLQYENLKDTNKSYYIYAITIYILLMMYIGIVLWLSLS